MLMFAATSTVFIKHQIRKTIMNVSEHQSVWSVNQPDENNKKGKREIERGKMGRNIYEENKQ